MPSSRASRLPAMESWSVMAIAPRPQVARPWRPGVAGESVPSEAVEWMCRSMAVGRLNSKSLLQRFLFGLALDALGRHRPRLEPLDRDLLTAGFADPVGAVLDPLERLLDLLDQLALAVADAEQEIAVGLQRGPVGRVGEVLVGESSSPTRCRPPGSGVPACRLSRYFLKKSRSFFFMETPRPDVWDHELKESINYHSTITV